jgi:RND family efflux transporter, MFP subunit
MDTTKSIFQKPIPVAARKINHHQKHNTNIMKYTIILILSIALYSCSSNKNEEQKQTPAKAPVHYDTATIAAGGVPIVQKIPAQLAAYQEVSIYPKVNGYVKNVFIDMGSAVKKGQVLLTLEAPELIQSVLQAKEKYTKARADYYLDKDKFLRLKEAANTSGAISPFDLSSAKAKMEADSALANAEKANWKFQETMMGYLKVTAPFDGVITERNVHPGALISATDKTKPMLELKQVSHLRLQADVAEEVAVQLKEKDTASFFLKAFPGKEMKAVISRVSKNITGQVQSEKIETDVQNAANTLSPGMFAEMMIHLKGTPGAYYVPKQAVVTSTEGKYLWVIQNGKLQKENVATGNENETQVEVFGNIHEGEKIIQNPSDDLKP